SNSAVYRVNAGRSRFFLKMRAGDFDQISASVPAYLYSKGIDAVMAPIATVMGRLWVRTGRLHWMLYPFFDGKNGFERELSRAAWIALGEAMRQVHDTTLPPRLARRVPGEISLPRFRNVVKVLDKHVAGLRPFDSASARAARFWSHYRGEIRTVVARSAYLARRIPPPSRPPVLCHSDLHAGNVLVGRGASIKVVDWDSPVFARPERDLMFIGGGIGGRWNNPRQSRWFFDGYGPVKLDPIAIAFYRYERIVIDLAEYGRRIFDPNAPARDRLSNLGKLATAFMPDNVLATAHRTWADLF